MSAIRNVLIIANMRKKNAGPIVELCTEELKKRDISYVVNTPNYFRLNSNDILTDFDDRFRFRDYQLILSVGGDGTFLYTARTFFDFQIPVIGINAGRMGFLTEVRPEDFGKVVDKLLIEEMRLKERMLLYAVVLRGGKERYRFHFLNDAVISKGSLSRMVEFSLFLDDELLSRYRSDGLIVSTPTGSTAYNLAAGGPILTEDMRAMIITPICPHILGVRPIVTGENRELVLQMISEEEGATLTVDGQENCMLMKDDRIRITRSDHTVSLLNTGEKEFFNLLRNKLGWPL